MDSLGQIVTPHLEDWIFVKERGALAHYGDVYRSADGSFYLRTGEAGMIRNEAEFGRMAWQNGFSVPEVTEIGQFADSSGYFIEKSLGTENFGDLLGREYAAIGSISGETFDAFCEISLRFLAAQLKPSCSQAGPSQLRAGIQLENVRQQKPELADLLERAFVKAEDRTQDLPLVLTHGDLSPFNILTGGVIDFESRFIAPAGLDAITSIAFQRLWDHPKPDGTATMRLWDFDWQQIAAFMAQADAIFGSQGLPALSFYFDVFLMLKAIWALCFERPADLNSAQAQRWLWRKRMAVYCAECVLAGKLIESETFRAIGLKETE